MNYEPNTTQWSEGDLVIHDADAKTPSMLMKVIGYTKDGLVRTKYLNGLNSRFVWKNELKYLHDPKQFGIVVHD